VPTRATRLDDDLDGARHPHDDPRLASSTGHGALEERAVAAHAGLHDVLLISICGRSTLQPRLHNGNDFIGGFDRLFCRPRLERVAATFSKGVYIPEYTWFIFQLTSRASHRA